MTFVNQWNFTAQIEQHVMNNLIWTWSVERDRQHEDKAFHSLVISTEAETITSHATAVSECLKSRVRDQ